MFILMILAIIDTHVGKIKIVDIRTFNMEDTIIYIWERMSTNIQTDEEDACPCQFIIGDNREILCHRYCTKY